MSRPPPLLFSPGDLKLKSKSKSAAEKDESSSSVKQDLNLDVFSNQFDSASTQQFTMRPAIKFNEFVNKNIADIESLNKIRVKMVVANRGTSLQMTWNPEIKVVMETVEVPSANKAEGKKYENVVKSSGLLTLLASTIPLPPGITVLGKTGSCLGRELIAAGIIFFDHFMIWHMIAGETFDLSVDRLMRDYDGFVNFKIDPTQPTIDDALNFLKESVQKNAIHWEKSTQTKHGHYVIGPGSPPPPPPPPPPYGGKRTSRKKRNQK